MIILNLVGGLGNQLFQIAAALSLLEHNEKLIVEYGQERTRLLANGKPELDEYQFSEQISFSNRKIWPNGLVSRCYGFILRSQSKSNKSIIYVLINKVIVLATHLLLSINYKKRIHLVAPSNLGYSQLHRKKNILLSGYFQSNHWADTIPNVIDQLKCEPSEYIHFKELARIENPIVVHVRRGDYKNEDTFGLLSVEYYRNGIAYIRSTTDLQNIWLFSDEPESAKQLFASEPNLSIRVIDDSGITSAGLLEIMSLGKAYVIANSTFSWWGAYKSKSQHVVAPIPWFKSATGPSRLYPKHWHLTSSHFE